MEREVRNGDCECSQLCRQSPGKKLVVWGRERVSLFIHIGDINVGFYAEGICPVKREKFMMHEKENMFLKEQRP